MSRTRKDCKPKLPDFNDDEAFFKFSWWKMPLLRGKSTKWYQRNFWKKERGKVRVQLNGGCEPAPSRTRSTIKFNLS
jgi:hypothetical protein